MFKKIYFGLFLCFFIPSLGICNVMEQIDTPQNRAILKKVEEGYNSIRTLKAKFAQFNSKVKNDLQTGDIFISKPGKMRLIYEKGSPLEFYASNGYFVYHDKELKEVSYFELDKTPVQIILKEELHFDDPDFLVTNVQTILDEYFVTIIKKDAPDLGSLTLVIDVDTLELKQWDVLDVQGIKSTVSLFEIEKNIPVDNRLFWFDNPYKKGK